MFAAAFVISLFVEFWILRSRQQFTIIFNDFDSELPALFELVTSNWFAVIVPVLAVLSVAKEILVRNGHFTLICNGIHILLVLTVGGLYASGVFLPLIHLMDNQSG